MYVDDNAKDICVVADAHKISRPDIVINVNKGSVKTLDSRIVEMISIHNALKPRLGTFLLTEEPIEETSYHSHEEGVEIINIGYNQTKIIPIVDLLMSF
jgi:hypothetical protein